MILIRATPHTYRHAHYKSTIRHFFTFDEGSKTASTRIKKTNTKKKEGNQHYEKKMILASKRDMYDVVSDVSKYKEFLPWCVDSVVKETRGNTMIADLSIGFGMLNDKWTSHVQLDPEACVVIANAESGPVFHFLTSKWEIKDGPSENTCWATFSISYKFKSSVYTIFNDRVFSDVQKSMVTAFEKRCLEVQANRLNN
eukprot:TRINITY_DN7341_c0_g1_i1.p1 TRINITY_DN7341_c0_g1~~TRINITY_DN7341_c0_g1_i1.p1  ORF type:complete len:198 (+),score=31.56 TRINITY_DN7341_c0_g1_i1:3-596(+)